MSRNVKKMWMFLVEKVSSTEFRLIVFRPCFVTQCTFWCHGFVFIS